MKRKLQFKRILSLVAMTLLFAWGGGINTTLNAQRSDGFFRAGNDDSYSNRDDGMSLGDAVNENPTPLGSGLLIMMAAGAGYAVARRNRKSNSKKTKTSTTLFLALALILGMTQCKKSTVAPTTDNGIHITLNAGQGAKGDKTDFTPTSFVWTKGVTEYIYVGGSKHGACLGVLSGTGNGEATMSFSGSLTTTPNDGETLHFFYLGKGRDGSAITELDFSNQDGTLDNVTKYHIAIGDATYSTGQTSFSASLEMKMAIAYFNTSGFGSGNVYLHGDDIYTSVGISYNNGSLSYESTKKDYINIGASSAGSYVALIPSQNENETTLKFESNSKSGELVFLRGIKPRYFYSDNNLAALPVTAQAVTDDAIPGLFSVSSTKVIRFSKGNLQYQASTGNWRFAEHQYDYVGDASNGNVSVDEVKCNNANIAADYTGWIDLFGWATSGYNEKYPYINNTTTSDYFNNKDITGTNANYDWGVNNSSSILNGGSSYTWRTLTKDEWAWLLGPTNDATSNCRTVNTSGLPVGDNSTTARYTKGQVNGVSGIIVFPDNYTQPTEASVTSSNVHYNSMYSLFTTFMVTGGWNYMEQAGAVFLPAAGYRDGSNIDRVNTYGYYWSSSKSSATQSYKLIFYNAGGNPQTTYTSPYTYVYNGHSVRLVRDVE